MGEKTSAKLAASVEARILLLRGQRVMLSTHLADLYGVEPKVLVQAVKRNVSRFPEDFMFQLSREEFNNLKSHIVTSSWGGLRRATPYAFTEQGVAMLSSVLNSPKAIRVNIEIMRAFVRLRQMLQTNTDLAGKLAALEEKYDAQFKVVFDAIRQIMTPPAKARRSIGFRVEEGRRDTASHGHASADTARDDRGEISMVSTEFAVENLQSGVAPVTSSVTGVW